MNCERVGRAERGLGCALCAQCNAFLDSSSCIKFAANNNALFIVLLARHLQASLEILTHIVIRPLIALSRGWNARRLSLLISSYGGHNSSTLLLQLGPLIVIVAAVTPAAGILQPQVFIFIPWRGLYYNLLSRRWYCHIKDLRMNSCWLEIIGHIIWTWHAGILVKYGMIHYSIIACQVQVWRSSPVAATGRFQPYTSSVCTSFILILLWFVLWWYYFLYPLVGILQLI